MIRAVIVEDSRLARQELKELLKVHSQIHIIAEAASADIALELIKKEDPDLIFLDIHLPGKSGFDLLAELDYLPAVIFTTAFDQYALQSFNYNTVDYLLKPIVPDRLAAAIQKSEALLGAAKPLPTAGRLSAQSRIFVKDGSKCWFVTLSDIRLFESKGNYTQIFFNNDSPLILKTLQQLEDTLDEKMFLRVNRQQIVNVNFISSVTEWFGGRLKLTLNTGESIEVSRRQVSKLRELFSL
ncbi:LytR/AlgR family response regulator transcription factor [Pedobacter duraquae]|uniref:LytTR family two component transcriptional regulator n=1 Tax=Pedobacter duraquae TaxID=425511 RepID=A0A4R6IMG5_9SPHI|nr:LytTR family transcriptional regulator DNA-binding domain-containing protein [Pedobacter duraquae]TDO23360.1 LytTR family two component transcriptional regulator [Pedobacter duraquae]